MIWTDENIFFIGKVFWELFNPVQVLFITLFVSLPMLLSSWKKFAKYLLFFSVGVFLFIGIIPTKFIAAPLENYFPQTQLPPQEQVEGIFILGGSINLIASEKQNRTIFDKNKKRVSGGIEMMKHYPAVRVVYSGSNYTPFVGRHEGYYFRKYLKSLGIKRKIIYEKYSRTTYENARYASSAVSDFDKKWILVTSAVHMPRSIGLFRKEGLNVVPYPVDYIKEDKHSSKPFSPKLFISNYFRFNQVMKEYISLLAFYVLGKTDHLLPLR